MLTNDRWRRILYRTAALTSMLCLSLLSATHAARADDGMFTKTVLDGGVTLVTQDMRGDLAAACLFVGAGSAYEGEHDNGVTALLNRVILACHPLSGTTPPALRIEQLGGVVSAETSGYYTCFSLVVPVRNFPEALKVFAQAVTAPDFSEATFKAERGALSVRRDWIGDRLADRAFSLFMEKTYVGQPSGMDPYGTPKSIERLGNKDVQRWHEEYYRPSNMTLSIAAGISPARVERIVGEAFRPFAPAARGAARPGKPADGGPCGRSSVHEKPTAYDRAAAVIGYDAPGPGSPDYPAMRLVHALLADGMGSSVFRELRDRSASAYAFGSVMPRVSGSARLAFYVVTDPDRAGPAVDGIKRSVESLKAGRITDEDVSRARALVLGELSLASETASGRAWSAGYHEAVGLGPDYPGRLASDVGKAGRKELQAAAGRYLDDCTLVMLRPVREAR